MSFTHKHLLSIEQLTLADLEQLFKLALKLEPYAQGKKSTRVLEGHILGNLLFEPSTRTRLSFGCAFQRLGGAVQDVTSSKTTSLSKGESLSDTLKVIAGYVDVMVVRHSQAGALDEVAENIDTPIINGGDGNGEHPSQALLDGYTIYKHFKQSFNHFNNLHIAMVGDLKNGRTVHSLSKLLNLFKNVNFHFIAPAPLQMPNEIITKLKASGHSVSQTEDFAKGVKSCDVIYMTRIQQERFESPADAEKYKGMYAINRQFFDQHCKSDAIILHPLPRDSRPGNEEISTDMDNHPALRIFKQANNGIPIRMALFALILDVDKQIK